MADIIRWDPFRELLDMRRDWESVFDNRFFRPFTQNGWHAPRVNMYQTDEDVVADAAMPGIKNHLLTEQEPAWSEFQAAFRKFLSI